MVKITEDEFGVTKLPSSTVPEIVKRFTFANANGVTAQVITYGAAITSIKIPDRNGIVEDIALGFDGMNGYLSANNPYFGATIGRVCNRTREGKFTLHGKEYNLAQNRPPNHLHGGNIGFDKFNWSAVVNGDRVVMTLVNDDGFEGYPGTVLTSVTYELTDSDEFKVSFTATTSKPTPINLTNHSYYNLAGHGAGYEELYNHSIALNADKYTVTDDTAVSTGEIHSVAGTPFDLRIRQNLGAALVNLPKLGFDNNYCVTQGTEQQLTFVARLVHEKTGRSMEVYSDQPGVQFYTSNFMPDPENNIYPKGKTAEPKAVNVNQPIAGKGGAQYQKHAGFALETQKYPDSVNHANFPSIIVLPGDVYRHNFVYKFGVE
ncbi:galactose mutarotase-like [Bradysia coprophila]|uniref:galactose mutarotase-like n=1 Tax=Bradysia coprophila TaxID=38358 RepID=UPI00187D9395|nr:galactose mutarotase-like [Bradysia coprophila]